MKTIAIPGVGDIDFPDEMSDDDISNAIKTKIIPSHQAASAPVAPAPNPDADKMYTALLASMEKSDPGYAPARAPTPQELNRPDFSSYQQPVHNLLNSPAANKYSAQPAPAVGQDPEAMQPTNYPPRMDSYQQPDLAAALEQSRRDPGNLQATAERLPISNLETASAAAKGAAGALPGVPSPNMTTREQQSGGQYIGAMIPPVGILAAPAIAPAAMAAYAGEESIKNGGIDPTTGAPNHPFEAAVQTAIGAVLGQYGHTLIGRVAGLGGMGVVSAAVEEAARQKQQNGEISVEDANNPEFLKSLAVSVIQGLLGAQGAPHGEAQSENQAPQSASAPISKELIDSGIYGKSGMQEGAQGPQPAFYPPAQDVPRGSPPQAEAAPPMPPRERGLFDAAAVPEDMQGRQWAAGTEAQTALREAMAAREPLAKEHEDALRASVAAENALRSRFPDEEVSPKYPAERDLLRALRAKHLDAEATVDDTKARLDEAAAAVDEAQKNASRAQETPLPDVPMDRLKGRQEVIRAMQEAGLPPEHIQRAVQTMDLRPEIYELGAKAVDLSPDVLNELGIKENVSRETPPENALLTQPSELARRTSDNYRRMVDEMNGQPPRENNETHIAAELDFGEGSPYAKKYPNFSKMPFEDKMRVTKSVMGDAIQRAARHAGISVPVESYGAGKWGKWDAQPSTNIRVHGTPEQVDRFASALGYLTQQTGVFSFRKSESGKGVGFRVLEDHGFFEDPHRTQQFWNELSKELPDLPGFSHHVHDGQAGIFVGIPEATREHQAELERKILPAVQRMMDKLDLTGDAKFLNVDIKEYGHDWTKDENGTTYLQRLGGEGRSGVQGQSLVSDARQVEARIQQGLRAHGALGPEPLFQEHDPAHGGSERNGSGELGQKFGIDAEALARNAPEAAQSVYSALGNKVDPGRNTQAELKIYPLHDLPPEKLAEWLAREGWNYKVFGPDQETGKFIPPNFKEFSYDNKHAWIFSPWTEHGSFRDTEYTRTWRVTHEVAHGQTNDALTEKYGGVGKRQGALGRDTKFNGRDIAPLSLADAMRAVEWEHETFQRQREILEKELGIKITDEQFRKENSINMSDALYRVLSGDFSNPGDLGLIPRALAPEQTLARAKDILRAAAKDAGLDMAETFGEKSGQHLFQDGLDAKGAFLPSTAEKKGMVYLVKGKADISTVLHEWLGHGLEEKLRQYNPDLIDEAGRLMAKDIGDAAVNKGAWTREGKEWFARKVEQYFHDGNTDVTQLKPLFEFVRKYMQKVYEAVVGGPMGKGLTGEERAYFDKVFGAGEKAKAVPRETAPPVLNPQKEKPTPGVSSNGSREGIFSAKTPVSVRPELKSNASSGQAEKAPFIPGERSLPKTLEAAGVSGGTDREYDVKHLDESANAAIAEIKAKGAEAAQQDILGRPKFDPQDMPRAIALMRQWQHEADNLPPGVEKVTALAKTIQMASEMSKRATEAGQFNAMVRILERLSPDGVVYYAQKQLEKTNAGRGPKQQVKMKPETATTLRAAAKEIEASQTLADNAAPLANVAGKIEKGETLTADDIASLKAFRNRLSAYLGERPPEHPKGLLRGASPKPKAAAPAVKKAPSDNVEAVLSERENAALARLRARGLSPTKALLQTQSRLSEADISDLADVFASSLARRKSSVSAVRQNFIESFGPEIAPHLDDIAQRGARRLQEARRERVKFTELSKRVDAILEPLLKGEPQEVHQAEQFRAAFDAVKNLTGDVKREASWDLQEALNAMVPAGTGKRTATILALAQLLNPKTAMRNVIGNELFYRAERASKWVASNLIDWPRSKLTGSDRVLTFRTGGQGDYWKNFMLGSKAAIRGVNPDGLESKYDLSGGSFNDKKNPFYWAERAMGVTLRAPDYAAFKRAFGETMGEMAELSADRRRVQGNQRDTYIKNWIENASPEVIDIAEAYGKYATFQDATALATGAAGLKKFLNGGKDFGLGNFIINYPKTPANILMRAIEYSPAGLAKSLYILADTWRTGIPRDTRELEMSLGRVLVGGVGGGLAWYLAKNGALSGQADKDKDVRAFKKEQTGQANYQVNVSAIGRWLASGLKKDQLNKRDGDTLISYDWAQPLAINAAMTATAVQALSDKKHPIEGAASTAEAALEGATKTLEEQPLLQGLEQLFNSDKSIPGRLMNILEGVPASFSPTLLNQIRQIKDNSARDTQAPTMWARMINKVMYRLPFLSEKLPLVYKTLGKSEPREIYQNGNNSLFNVFMNPAFVAKYHIDPDLAVILNPYETEGRKNQFPNVISKRELQYSEHGARKVYEMSGPELSELQRRLAQETYQRFQAMHLEHLKDKTPEHQEKILANGVNDSWNKVRKEFLREKGIHAK